MDPVPEPPQDRMKQYRKALGELQEYRNQLYTIHDNADGLKIQVDPVVLKSRIEHIREMGARWKAKWKSLMKS
jgi:hypothetical protein